MSEWRDPTLDPIDEPGECGLLDAEALRKVTHPAGVVSHDAQQLRLHRGQVVPYGDARVDRLHQTRQLHERRGRVQLCSVRGSGPSRLLPRLRRLGHWNKVHGTYCSGVLTPQASSRR